ncbi:MAG: hypothetical protein Q7U10_07595 [Thermodesulfovibrionia bacterium]|nr:hypothetical protein [Thermodesulfovibrionia bacterium]
MDKWIEGEIATQEVKQEKPSRLWMLYHLWAGICLKVYGDISGFSEVIQSLVSGEDSVFASNYAGFSAIIAVVPVAFGYYLSQSITRAIDGLAITQNRRAILKTLLPIAFFIGAILLAMATTQFWEVSVSSSRRLSTDLQQSDIQPVVAITTTQSSEGITEADLDQAVLANLETWVMDTILKKGKDSYADMGYDPENFKPQISASSAYVTTGDKKLAIIKVDIDNSVRSVTIIGLEGSELHRVSCIREGSRDIPVWSGECGTEIKKTHGVSIQP